MKQKQPRADLQSDDHLEGCIKQTVKLNAIDSNSSQEEYKKEFVQLDQLARLPSGAYPPKIIERPEFKQACTDYAKFAIHSELDLRQVNDLVEQGVVDRAEVVRAQIEKLKTIDSNSNPEGYKKEFEQLDEFARDSKGKVLDSEIRKMPVFKQACTNYAVFATRRGKDAEYVKALIDFEVVDRAEVVLVQIASLNAIDSNSNPKEYEKAFEKLDQFARLPSGAYDIFIIEMLAFKQACTDYAKFARDPKRFSIVQAIGPGLFAVIKAIRFGLFAVIKAIGSISSAIGSRSSAIGSSEIENLKTFRNTLQKHRKSLKTAHTLMIMNTAARTSFSPTIRELNTARSDFSTYEEEVVISLSASNMNASSYLSRYLKPTDAEQIAETKEELMELIRQIKDAKESAERGVVDQGKITVLHNLSLIAAEISEELPKSVIDEMSEVDQKTLKENVSEAIRNKLVEKPKITLRDLRMLENAMEKGFYDADEIKEIQRFLSTVDMDEVAKMYYSTNPILAFDAAKVLALDAAKVLAQITKLNAIDSNSNPEEYEEELEKLDQLTRLLSGAYPPKIIEMPVFKQACTDYTKFAMCHNLESTFLNDLAKQGVVDLSALTRLKDCLTKIASLNDINEEMGPIKYMLEFEKLNQLAKLPSGEYDTFIIELKGFQDAHTVYAKKEIELGNDPVRSRVDGTWLADRDVTPTELVYRDPDKPALPPILPKAPKTAATTVVKGVKTTSSAELMRISGNAAPENPERGLTI